MTYQSPTLAVDNMNVMEDEAWHIVALAVLLALGATIVLGAMAWCFMYARESFTGSWTWSSPFSVKIECR
ncbi:hypothetical protein [Halobacillus sp. Marseille-Q1614]|uniref:hypothetical protein n=1 Tax=Halobacillus sp. Marseille-Q1614 TaxID=2709134 RepID=UPI00156D9A63|nr:hypothetical protein [Halobacillus sp. Marseille-Q1614]